VRSQSSQLTGFFIPLASMIASASFIRGDLFGLFDLACTIEAVKPIFGHTRRPEAGKSRIRPFHTPND